MGTSKHRYNISFNPHTEAQIAYIAKTQGKPFSRVVQDLTEKALELDEDAYLCKLVEEVERTSDGNTISMDEFWDRNDAREDEEYE